MGKPGDQFVDDMIDRGRREVGGFFFHDSNIAQPMYPLRGGYAVTKETASLGMHEHGSTLAERLKEPDAGRDDRERDDREQGMELE